MKLLYFLSLFFMISYHPVSAKSFEASEGTPLKADSTYSKLKNLYIKYITSESYHKFQPLEERFVEKIHFKDYHSEIKSLGFDAWLNSNIQKTDYATLEEAKLAYKEMSKAIADCTAENKAYFDMLMIVLSTEEGREIWKKVVEDTAREYPDIVESPEAKMRRRLLRQ